MYIGKLVKLEQDYVLQKGLSMITQVLYSEASHPYQYNDWCMYKHITVFNQTTKQNQEFAILINWDHKYDRNSGKLKIDAEGLPNRD